MAHAVLRALVVALLIGACAPVSSFRPASGLMPENSLEFGAGASAVSPRPYVTEDWSAVGALWVTSEFTERSDLSAIVAFDDEALALGGSYRFYYLRHDRFSGGADGELGFAWAAFSLPIALRLFDQTHLYAAPRIGNWGLDPIFGVPVGVSARIYQGFMLRAEWQRSWQDFAYYNRRDHFGFAGAYQF